MIISIGGGKVFNKIHHIMIKSVNKLVIDNNFFYIIKAISETPPLISYIIAEDKSCYLRSGKREGFLFMSLLFNIIE